MSVNLCLALSLCFVFNIASFSWGCDIHQPRVIKLHVRTSALGRL